MRIVICVNCHVREFEARMERIHRLAALAPDMSIRVITTALLSDRQFQEVTHSGVDVWSVPRIYRRATPGNIPDSAEPQVGIQEQLLQRLWLAFCSDRHISDLADIGTYATRAYSADDLLVAFHHSVTILQQAILKHPPNVILPGAPDNYLSAMAMVVGEWIGCPTPFAGGSDLCGPGSTMVLDTLSSGNTRFYEYLARVSSLESPGIGATEERPRVDGPTSISAFLQESMKDQPFAVAQRDRLQGKAYLGEALGAVRSCMGSARDTASMANSVELLLTTTEGTAQEALSKYARTVTRRMFNARTLQSATADSGSSPRRLTGLTVLVPLHYQPEAYITPAFPAIANQVMWVRLLSLSLPPDAILLVKEHPLQDPGWRPHGFYRELLGIPRVSLCDPRTTSSQLLARGDIDLICTIGGSIAIEARQVGISVVSVLESISASYPGVRRLNPLHENFGSSLLGAIKEPSLPPSAVEVETWYAGLRLCSIPVSTDLFAYEELITWALGDSS